MSTITLPNIRVSSDLTVSLKLKDDGVAIDWSTLSNVKVSIYSDAQRALAGRCSVSIDEDDPTLLVCTYAANKPQYVGVNRVVVCAKYMGETKTYDKPAFNFVRWTDDQAGQTITIDDPDIDVEISVEDISSSILQEAVDAAFTAADRANDAAAAAEHMVDIHTGPQGEDGKSAYQCAVDEGYIGTEEEWLASLNGTDGADGDPAGFGTVSASVGANTGTPSVTVTTSGPDTAKNITFAFDNLKGATGETGATPAFSIGTVTTGAAGSQAAATITGTAAAPILNLTIPQGDQGNTGSSVDYAYELVNNLTTNDATKGLSAAQGVVLDGKVSQLEAEVDDLETAIDLQEETRTETKTLVAGTDYTTDYGYCPSAGGQLGTNSNFKHSSLISVLAGDVISVRCAGPNSIAVIAKQRDATNYDALVLGSAWNTVNDYTYTATEAFQLLVSWQISNSSPDAIIKITRTETVITSAIGDLQEDMGALQASQTALENAMGEVADDVLPVVTDDLTTDLVTGKYVTHAGSLVTNSSFSYKEFAVRAGAVVVFDATIHQNVAAISKVRINAHPNAAEVGFEELVPATSTTADTFTYTATENMTIAVCFNNTATRSITITTNEVGANTANIVDIIGNEETYAKALMVTDINYGYMFDKIAVIGDSLASGRVEGIVGQSDAAGRDFYNFSWLSFLSKRWRCSAFKNYSNAGADTASWLTDWLPVMQADSVVYDAYFIALGTNNEYNESDPSGDQTNYEAFIQRYNDIIDAVRTKAPNAAIFIMSLYEPRAGYGSATLENIAETRMLTDDGVFYIDFVNESGYYRYSSQVNWRGHFSSTGYVYVASAIARMVDKIIWDNKTEEFWIQFAKYHNGS